ncbi:MAG: DUF5060 domain-containing protein [Rikenellaceae bacterium]
MRVLISILFIFITTFSPVDAAIKSIGAGERGAISVSRHEVFDIPFVAKERSASPFDVELVAIFISPTGAEQRVPAFYNGNNEWVVRFSAGEVGEWSYTTTSDLRSMSGKKGLLTVGDSIYGGRRGKLVASKSSVTNFEWEDGSPCFLIAFGCDFLYALDYHNSDDAPSLNTFVNNIAKEGFNHVIMNVYAYDIVFDLDSKLSKKQQYIMGGDEKIYPFWGSNAKPNYSMLDVNFFRRLDRTIERLNDSNIVAQLVIYNWDTGVNWAAAGSKEDSLYFDYVVKRYQAFSNVVWSISGSFGDKVSDEFIIDKCSRLRDLDTFDRLVTVGDDGFCQYYSGAVDFISRRSTSVYSDREAVKKPTLCIDNGGFEECGYKLVNGLYVEAEQCLRRSYEVLFGGEYVTYYWQGAAFSLLFYNVDSLPRGVDRPKMEYYRYLNSFFTRHPYADFKPVSGLSDSSLCMGDSDGRSYLLYIPKEMSTVSANGVLSKGQCLLFQWFNTTTGEYSDVWVGRDVTAKTMPVNPWHLVSDAVLIVKILE